MNEILAGRLRKVFAGRKDVAENRMFGGMCFLLRGNMLCGTGKSDFMFGVGKEQDMQALARPGARPMDITGKVMKGFVWVDSRSCDGRALRGWSALDLTPEGRGRDWYPRLEYPELPSYRAQT